VTVLVTGATGFIGYEVARQLTERGERVRALTRRLSRSALLTPMGVEVAVGNLSDREALRRALVGCDGIIHLAARATFEDADTLRPSIVGGSARLIEVAAEQGIPRFAFGSSLLVHGDHPVGEIDARTPPRPAVDYGIVKVEAEQVLAREAAAAGIALASVRLPHVYGARDLLFGGFRRRVSVLPMRRDARYAHLHVRDAARVLIAALDQGWTGTAPVGDATNATWDRFFRVVQRHQPRHRIITVPTALALAGTAVGERVLGLRSGQNMVKRDTVRSAALELPVDPAALWGDLGLEPELPTVEEGIPAAMDELVSWRWRHSVHDRQP
jgi:nucleoside-diphosphate-sugar epimerase